MSSEQSTSGAQGLVQSTLPSNTFTQKEPVLKEGPIIDYPAQPVVNPPPPSGDNSPPPAITNATPATKKEGITFQQFFISILFLVLTGAAIYYGWTLGQLEGRGYLLYVQSFGSWLRSWFVKPTPSV
jgi:hypothetical protein